MTVPFPSHLDNHYCKEEEEGNYGPKFTEAYGASHINNVISQKEKDPGSELAHTKLTVELADGTVKYPKGIAENVLVGIGKFTFPVDFIILDIPEDIKVPLILERPFLSTARAKIDVYKRKITLRVREEKIIFKSVKPASSLIKRVYMLSLRERMELNLEARLMGETLVLNISLDPFLEDYIIRAKCSTGRDLGNESNVWGLLFWPKLFIGLLTNVTTTDSENKALNRARFLVKNRASKRGNVCLIFTKGDLKEVNEEVAKYKVGAPARVGLVAPVDVVVPPANTGLDPSQTSFFQVLNIPTKINKGTVEIITPVELIKKGLTHSRRAVEKLLGCALLSKPLLIIAVQSSNHLSLNLIRLIKLWTLEDCQRVIPMGSHCASCVSSLAQNPTTKCAFLWLMCLKAE
ncbi:zinc finger, CCHC-type containing protein [Tanacetum coccineum]